MPPSPSAGGRAVAPSSASTTGAGANGFESRYAEPNGMVIMEIWKVDAGEIVHVESILDVFEYGRPLGWG